MLKRLSVQGLLALYLGTFISVLMLLFCFLQYSAMEQKLGNVLQTALKNDVADCRRYISVENGQLIIDDTISDYEDVSLFVFSEEKELLFGRSFGSRLSEEFVNRTMRKTTYDGREWYLYEESYRIPGWGSIWIRGANSTGTILAASHNYTIVAVLSMIIFVGLSVAGIFQIVRRVFAPMTKIVDTANQINDGDDLSRRIQMSDGSKEFVYMANSFDRMIARIEQSFEKEKQFTSDASHELRTPISVILGESSYALEQDALPDYRLAMENIQKQASQLSRLISQLLAISRMDSGHQKLCMESFSLSELAEAVCEQMEEPAQKVQIRIETQIEPDVWFYGDQTMILRLLMNLLTNAVRYGKEGGFVRVSVKQSEQDITVSVADDGIGIAPDQQEKIWDRFYQVDAARTPRGEGCGLGLYIVRWIAQQHQGQVFLESTLGKGSVFSVVFEKTFQNECSVYLLKYGKS